MVNHLKTAWRIGQDLSQIKDVDHSTTETGCLCSKMGHDEVSLPFTGFEQLFTAFP